MFLPDADQVQSGGEVRKKLDANLKTSILSNSLLDLRSNVAAVHTKRCSMLRGHRPKRFFLLSAGGDKDA